LVRDINKEIIRKTLIILLLSLVSISIFGQNREIRNEELFDIVPLDDDWVCYGKTLDLANLNERSPVRVKFPHLWNGQVIGEDTLENIGYATYRLVLELENPHPPISLMLEDMYSAYSLSVNGEVMAKNGRIATSKKESKAEWLPQTVRLPSDTNRYELILQISNFHHSKGGLAEPILIGVSDRIEYLDLQRKAYSLMLTGSLILGGLFFIGLFWFGRNELSMFFFSMFCLVYTYRVIGTDYYVLHQIFPELPWIITIRLEYITLFLSVFLFVNFAYSLFPKETSKDIRDLISFISVGFALITIFSSPYYFSQLITPYFVVLVTLIVYGFWVFYHAYKKHRPGAQYGMISVFIVFGVFLSLVADYFGWFTATDAVIFFGYIAFFFSQSLILSYRFSHRLKQSIEESEMANKVKTDFLSTISHELRTPLNAITGMTRLLEDNNPRTDQTDYLRSLRFSSNNLTALVNDILDFSKIEKGKIVIEQLPFLLTEVFNQAITTYETVAMEKGLTFDSNIDPRFHGLWVKSDQTRLNQVINNLLANAIKFTEKGKVELKVEWIEENAKEVTINVEIEDTGVGIAPDKLEKIFYQFTQLSSSSTREFGGVGLGLSIVRNILHALGSKITVASSEGEGSRFGFKLTLPKPLMPKNGIRLKKPEESKSSASILLVEDNPMNALIAEQFLKGMNHKLTKCQNGQEAVELAFETDFDLILMDIHMPIKDGFQATTEILINKPHQKIIALTASLTASDMDKLDRAGFKDSLIKPFRKEDLEVKIKTVLSGR
jgi:signal transduction histidine kinase